MFRQKNKWVKYCFYKLSKESKHVLKPPKLQSFLPIPFQVKGPAMHLYSFSPCMKALFLQCSGSWVTCATNLAAGWKWRFLDSRLTAGEPRRMGTRPCHLNTAGESNDSNHQGFVLFCFCLQNLIFFMDVLFCSLFFHDIGVQVAFGCISYWCLWDPGALITWAVYTAPYMSSFIPHTPPSLPPKFPKSIVSFVSGFVLFYSLRILILTRT